MNIPDRDNAHKNEKIGRSTEKLNISNIPSNLKDADSESFLTRFFSALKGEGKPEKTTIAQVQTHQEKILGETRSDIHKSGVFDPTNHNDDLDKPLGTSVGSPVESMRQERTTVDGLPNIVHSKGFEEAQREKAPKHRFGEPEVMLENYEENRENDFRTVLRDSLIANITTQNFAFIKNIIRTNISQKGFKWFKKIVYSDLMHFTKQIGKTSPVNKLTIDTLQALINISREIFDMPEIKNEKKALNLRKKLSKKLTNTRTNLYLNIQRFSTKPFIDEYKLLSHEERFTKRYEQTISELAEKLEIKVSNDERYKIMSDLIKADFDLIVSLSHNNRKFYENSLKRKLKENKKYHKRYFESAKKEYAKKEHRLSLEMLDDSIKRFNLNINTAEINSYTSRHSNKFFEAVEKKKMGFFTRVKKFLQIKARKLRDKPLKNLGFNTIQEKVEHESRFRKKSFSEKISDFFAPMGLKLRHAVLGFVLMGIGSGATVGSVKMLKKNDSMSLNNSLSSLEMLSLDEEKDEDKKMELDDEVDEDEIIIENVREDNAQNDMVPGSISEDLDESEAMHEIKGEVVKEGDTVWGLSSKAKIKHRDLVLQALDKHPELKKKNHYDWMAALALANDVLAERNGASINDLSSHIRVIKEGESHLILEKEAMQLAILILENDLSVNSLAYKMLCEITGESNPNSELLTKAVFPK